MRIAIIDPASFVLPYDAFYAQGLLDSGHCVDIYCSSTHYNEALLDELTSLYGERVHIERYAVSRTVSRSRLRGLAAYARMLVTVCRRRRAYDLVNMQFGIFVPIDLLFMFAMRRQIALTVHDDVPHGFTGKSHWPTRLRVACARRLVFTSQAVRDRFTSRYGEQAKRAHLFTLQHGTLGASLRPMEPLASEGRTDDPIVTFFGTVKPYKGVQLLVDLAEMQPTERIEIYGKWGRELAELQRLATARGVVVRDSYLSPSSLHSLLNERRLFVLPYKSASQSGVLYLLLHYAKPFVSTARGDLGDFLRREGLRDLIVEADDPHELAERIRYAKAHYASIESELARVRRRYDWRQIIQKSPLFAQQ